MDCPVPRDDYERVVLGHGSGGRLSAELLERVFLSRFRGAEIERLEDSAVLAFEGEGRIALTTDSFVVSPIFFPGGDIGRLAVCGTVNDLSVSGAEPLFLTAAFVLEEGLFVSDLERVVDSMKSACDEIGVELVAGDTKVVDRGKGDQIFITTTGFGRVPAGRSLSVAAARPGDRVIVSGPIGDHGVAILSVRAGLEFESPISSDCAPLSGFCSDLLREVPGIRAMRDPTRGGLASALIEIARTSGVGVRLHEGAIPVRDEVRGACELLGLDPLYVACEGRVVAIVPEADVSRALECMRRHPLGGASALIGEVVAERPGSLTLKTNFGTERVVPLLAGEQLPRIC